MSTSNTDYIRTTKNPGHDDKRIFYGNPNPDSPETTTRSHNADALGLTSFNMNEYQRQFLASTAVSEAINLFKSSPQADLWLARLRALVESIITPTNTPITDLTEIFTGDLDGTEALQTAYNNLNSLVSEFRER